MPRRSQFGPKAIIEDESEGLEEQKAQGTPSSQISQAAESRGMSIKAMTSVWEKSQHKGSTLLLLLAIADYAHDDGTGAWPSIDTLAKKTRMSVRNTQRLVDTLRASGEVTVISGGGPHGTNLYAVVLAGDKLSGVTFPAPDVTRSVMNDGVGLDLEVGLVDSSVRESLGDIPGEETSELDRWLGPTERSEMTMTKPKPTGWPNVEERLRAVLDVFCDTRDYKPDNPIERKQLIAGARDFVDSIGERPDLLREAMHDYQARGKGYMVATPRSLITWCRNYILEHKPKDPGDYLKGVGKDFFDG